MPSSLSSRRAVVVSFLVDVPDVVTTGVVAALTGSAVVFAELAQGLVAVALYRVTGSVAFDAVGALLVGVLLALSSMLVIAQARALIAGRAARPR